MPSKLKQVATHTFTDGITTSLAREVIPNTFAEYILNCNVLSQGAGNVGIITNVKGNTLVDFDLPAGQNTVIGTAKDEENNNFYYFLYNSTGLHGIYKFNGLTKSISRILQNLTDTGNIDIMNLNPDYLILHADVIDGKELHWVDGLNNARKTNLNKLVDKSSNGYGSIVLQSYIDAYKQTARFAPTVKYISDISKPFNRLYGALYKFAVRFYYVDGEKSTFSDFSNVPLPSFEPFTGVNVIPTANNAIEVSFPTGSHEVIQIEVAMQSTTGEVNDEGLLPWKSVAIIDKRRLNLSDESQYTYTFYNEGNYSVLDINQVLLPYSFMFKRPLCQSFVKNAMTQSNGYEGFEVVQVLADIVVTYEDLYLEDGVENDFNEPYFNLSFPPNSGDYMSSGLVTDYNGVVSLVGLEQNGIWGPRRFNRMTLTIGSDVKKGNTFVLTITNGASDYFTFSYTAKNTDSSLTIANKFTQFLTATGRIFRLTPELPDSNIYNQTNDAGNISFTFIFMSERKEDYNGGSASVNPVQFNTLKDTGESISNQKLGGSEKFAFEYEDFDGRKSLGYTNDDLIVGYKTINELDGFKVVVRTFTIRHTPPIWAKYWQLLRSSDLTYGDYIQLLIQKVVPVNEDDAQEFLDLVVGSLFTYQKIHPNTSLVYEFTKGDRIRLIKNADTQDYYDFFETEIVAYNTGITENITDNLTTNGSATVTVTTSNIGNVGKIILVDGNEREIIDAPSGTTYLLNNVIGDSTAKTYLHYELIDRRGTIRIRKPATITIADNSIVELYKPSGLINPLGSKQFYEFGKKFNIINAGTENAYHGGDVDQTDTTPAIVRVDEGTAYVRNREMPINNSFPGTQLIIDGVEDPQFSDFYSSLYNDNGRVNAEDTGVGEVHFGSRTRFSQNYIEDTRINGLNIYSNLDRVDNNDQYGDIMLTKFDANRLYVFKELKTGIIPVDERITQDNNGLALNVSSAKLLNPMQYFAWEGGIGNVPESYTSNATQKYFVSPNSGVIIRIGGNGEEPISKTYGLDNKAKELISEAVNNKARIFGGFDRLNGVYIITIEGYNKYIYFDGFTGWVVDGSSLPSNTMFEIVTAPTHGTTSVSGIEITYEPTTDYIGTDSFTYRAFIGGAWSQPKTVCLTIVDTPATTAWRQRLSDSECEIVEGTPTGMRKFITLEQYKPYDNTLTGETKPNSPSDPDYVPPVYDPACDVPEPPVCPDRVLVFQICNSNSVIDDNFDIFLNDVYIGAVDLNQNAQIGSVFIGSLSTPDIVSSDFVCPLEDMVTYYFDPALLIGGINNIKMVNTQNNGSGNAGDVGVRNYLITGDDLSAPCVVADLAYSGSSGSNFELEFNYTECCPEDEGS